MLIAQDTSAICQAGEEFVLTIRNPAVIEGKKGLGVSYEAFVDDVQVCHKRTPFHEILLPAWSLLFLIKPHFFPPTAISLCCCDTTSNDCVLPASAHNVLMQQHNVACFYSKPTSVAVSSAQCSSSTQKQ